jgi:hypothetical protein
MEKDNSPGSDPGSPADEAQIAALLEQIRPSPSNRFYLRMAGAPWKRSRDSRLFAWRSLRLAMVGFVLLVVAATAMLSAPALRAAARQWMNFFIPNPTETFQLDLTAPSPGNLNVYDSPGYFPLSLAEAEQQAGFAPGELSLTEVSAVLTGLEFAGAHYDAELNLLISRYSVDGRSLYLSKRLAGTIQEYSSIGPQALVEKVIVHGVEGEYVAGGWVTTQALPATPQPGDPPGLEATWDPGLPQRILRWQQGEFRFEILASASLGRKYQLEQGALILIAEAVK